MKCSKRGKRDSEKLVSVTLTAYKIDAVIQRHFQSDLPVASTRRVIFESSVRRVIVTLDPYAGITFSSTTSAFTYNCTV